MSILIATFKFRGQELRLVEERYKNNQRLAVLVEAEDNAPYATLSCNIVDQRLPDEDCFFVKNWSENEDLATAVRDANIFELTGQMVPTGRVFAPVWRIKRYVWVVGREAAFRSKEAAEEYRSLDSQATITRVRLMPDK